MLAAPASQARLNAFSMPGGMMTERCKNVFEAILKYGHDEDWLPSPAAKFDSTDAPAGSHPAVEDGSQPDGFAIKGNAQSQKFHQPGGRWYDQTVAEIWFDTPESAEKAGFAEAGK
jgi:hypothetical protein